MEPPSLLVLLNPRLSHGSAAPAWARTLSALRAVAVVELRETVGTGADRRRIADWLAVQQPRVAVAAGGDGTVTAVAAALMDLPPAVRPALGIVPLGTANNVARSLGLYALRGGGSTAVQSAVDALLGPRERALDLGCAVGQWFAGSFAVGMDAEILATRNRWRAHLGLGGGYPLYLVSCALELGRYRRTRARLTVDGARRDVWLYNLLLLNTALYAGEFRFDAADASGDGRLDLHVFDGAADYVRRFAAAWRRHLAHRRATAVAPPTALRRIAQLTIELDRPMASQFDGEQGPCAARFTVEVYPAALRVRVPG